jgi:hypothetical protein
VRASQSASSLRAHQLWRDFGAVFSPFDAISQKAPPFTCSFWFRQALTHSLATPRVAELDREAESNDRRDG